MKPESIKWQSGDFHRSNDVFEGISQLSFLILRNSTSTGLTSCYINSVGNSEYWYHNPTKKRMDRDRIRHGILSPRMPVTYSHDVVKRGYPNMLGGYIENSHSQMHFKSDEFKGEF